MEPVKAAPFEPKELVNRFAEAGDRHGFRVQTMTEIDGCPLIALTKRVPGPRPRVYVSSGVHGDEPAAPLALLDLLERGVFDSRAVWFLIPMVNPTGYRQGSRENRAGVDLNRDYRHRVSPEITAHVKWLEYQPRFDLAFCLHEDWESTGYYLYELNPDQRPSLAQAMIDAVSATYPIDLAAQIDERPAEGGIIRPDPDPANRDLWPEAIYLRAHHTSLCYTLEAPSAFPLADRIAMHALAIENALSRFCEGSFPIAHGVSDALNRGATIPLHNA